MAGPIKWAGESPRPKELLLGPGYLIWKLNHILVEMSGMEAVETRSSACLVRKATPNSRTSIIPLHFDSIAHWVAECIAVRRSHDSIGLVFLKVTHRVSGPMLKSSIEGL